VAAATAAATAAAPHVQQISDVRLWGLRFWNQVMLQMLGEQPSRSANVHFIGLQKVYYISNASHKAYQCAGGSGLRVVTQQVCYRSYLSHQRDAECLLHSGSRGPPAGGFKPVIGEPSRSQAQGVNARLHAASRLTWGISHLCRPVHSKQDRWCNRKRNQPQEQSGLCTHCHCP
jgi:hypothetical protein